MVILIVCGVEKLTETSFSVILSSTLFSLKKSPHIVENRLLEDTCIKQYMYYTVHVHVQCTCTCTRTTMYTIICIDTVLYMYTCTCTCIMYTYTHFRPASATKHIKIPEIPITYFLSCGQNQKKILPLFSWPAYLQTQELNNRSPNFSVCLESPSWIVCVCGTYFAQLYCVFSRTWHKLPREGAVHIIIEVVDACVELNWCTQ